MSWSISDKATTASSQPFSTREWRTFATRTAGGGLLDVRLSLMPNRRPEVVMSKFYIVSLKHTQARDPCVTFWRPDNSGYAWSLSRCGKYAEEQVREDFFYYNDGIHTVAVPCQAIEPLLSDPRPGVLNGDAGPVVENDKPNRDALIDAAMLATAEWEARRPPTGRNEYEGHADILQRVAELLLEDGLDRRTRIGLWKARSALLEVGFYGSKPTARKTTASELSLTPTNTADDAYEAAAGVIARAERKLAARSLAPGIR